MAERYVALIRGINVGRAKRVAMAELRDMLEGLGYSDVRTVLNSGNAVFDADESEPADIATRIQGALASRLKVDARVTVIDAPAFEVTGSSVARVLDKSLGDSVTSRNWTTVLKLQALVHAGNMMS